MFNLGDVSEVETLLTVSTKDDPTSLIQIKFHGKFLNAMKMFFFA